MKFTIKDFLNPNNTEKEVPYSPDTTGQGRSPIASDLLAEIEKAAGASLNHTDTKHHDSTFEVPNGKIDFGTLSELAAKHGFNIKK